MSNANYLQAIKWLDAQLLKPNEQFTLKEGVIIDDLHECLRSQKHRILYSIDPLRKLAFLRVREIKNYLNNQYK